MSSPRPSFSQEGRLGGQFGLGFTPSDDAHASQGAAKQPDRGRNRHWCGAKSQIVELNVIGVVLLKYALPMPPGLSHPKNVPAADPVTVVVTSRLSAVSYIRVWPLVGKSTPVPGTCTKVNDPPSLDMVTTPWNAEVGKETQFQGTAGHADPGNRRVPSAME